MTRKETARLRRQLLQLIADQQRENAIRSLPADAQRLCRRGWNASTFATRQA